MHSKGKAIAWEERTFGSYKEAVLRPRTFKPRFPEGHHHGWYNEQSMRGPAVRRSGLCCGVEVPFMTGLGEAGH
jgi:hypothetical protein